jgi:hypothetical protein
LALPRPVPVPANICDGCTSIFAPLRSDITTYVPPREQKAFLVRVDVAERLYLLDTENALQAAYAAIKASYEDYLHAVKARLEGFSQTGLIALQADVSALEAVLCPEGCPPG